VLHRTRLESAAEIPGQQITRIFLRLPAVEKRHLARFGPFRLPLNGPLLSGRKRLGPKAKQAAQQATAPREGSKTAQVVAMLQRKNGATLAEIMEKMNWQKHTVRGFMAGAMKKAGYTVKSFKSDKGERTYRINK
jgi:hypothetical protein